MLDMTANSFHTSLPNGSNLLSLSFLALCFLQLGMFLKKILKGDMGYLSKSEFVEAISRYLSQRTSLVSSDMSKFCICGGKSEVVQHIISPSSGYLELIEIQQKQLQVSFLV